jgi:hypothetical protein
LYTEVTSLTIDLHRRLVADNMTETVTVCVYGGRGDYKDLLLRLQRLVARPCTVLPPDHYATFSPCRIRPA